MKQINKWLITVTVMLPTIMEIIDTSVANVALPSMQGSLNAGTEEVTWVLTSYLVSNAVVLPMTGWLARLFGRKRFLITCIILFTLASLLCGSAPNLASLIFFRVIQGAAGGALIPISQAIMMETFPPYQRGMAMAIFGIGAMFGPIIGPALGGWITDNMNWRWIFYINIPIGLIAVVMASAYIHDPAYLKRTKMKIDYWGLLLLSTGFGSLQVVLDKGQQEDWFNSPFILAFSAISIISLIMMILAELRNPHPIVNLRLFKNISYAAGTCIMFVVGFCLYSSIMLIPLFLQTLMGYSATKAGMVLAPGGLATLLTMPLVGALLQKYDGRKLVLCGLSIGACAMFIMRGFTLDAAYHDFVWPRVVLGIGLAMTFVPLTTLTLATIPKEEMGNATGIFNLMRNIGGSFGIAIATTVLARDSQFFQTQLVSRINSFGTKFRMSTEQLKTALIYRGVDSFTAEKQATALIYNNIRRNAAMLSYNHIFWYVGLAFIAIIPLLLLLKRPVHEQH
jgi:DHA2 family multidrug resistance protein